jgi:Brp/Blh family beta-carotene 15,15'-monooxygenase
METPFAPVYTWARRVSRFGVIAVLVLLLVFQIFDVEITLSVQLIVALTALLVGIPHGAIDHLITIPRSDTKRFYLYIAIYIAIAVLAGWAIAVWNVVGFQLVVLMSALHFGYGDAAYLNEKRDSQKRERYSLTTENIYALPAGFLPVILPLTDSRTVDALDRINPSLDDWLGSLTDPIRRITIALALFAFLTFLVSRKFSLAIDIALLSALALFAPPLIAFATYFGFWHALRHTARLVPKLERASSLAQKGEWKRAIWGAIYPGLYAVGGTIGLAIVLMLTNPDEISSTLLWSTLLVIWALTVPHMATTSRFDLQALKES